MKHVGKMKNNGAKVIIVYRTLPGDPHSALVVGTQGLGESYHDSLIGLVNSDTGQQANEMADVMSVRKFPDGNNMLNWFHSQGLLRKVPTKGVIMTPTTKDTIPLDELNQIIADQKGVSIDELAVNDGTPVKKKSDVTKTTSSSVNEEADSNASIIVEDEMTPAQLRSKADALFKEAQVLRKQADAIDPPKSKAKKSKVEA